MFFFFVLYLGFFMFPPYIYSLQNKAMAHIKNEEELLLEEWEENEEYTSWNNLLAHTANKEKKPRQKLLITCKNGCCVFGEDNA